MTTKDRIQEFNALFDQIEMLLAKAERLGWDEIHTYEDCNDERAKAGWAMRDIASHCLWWIYNSSEYSEEWELLKKSNEL